jgi:hypothetical protein
LILQAIGKPVTVYFATVIAMVTYAADSEIQRAALVAIEALATASDTNRHKLAEAGACDSIVQATQKHCDDADIAQLACRALHAARFDDTKLNQAGVYEAVVAVLLQHSSHEQVALWGCCAVVAIIGWHDHIKTKLCDAGAATAVVAAMVQHTTSADVCNWGCEAVHKLIIYSSDANTVKLSNAGACAAVVTAMTAHPTRKDVQSSGCCTISLLSMSNTDVRAALGAAGACKAVVDVLVRRAMPKTAWTRSSADTWRLDAHQSAYTAVHYLARDNHAYAMKLGSADVCRALLTLVKSYKPESCFGSEQTAFWNAVSSLAAADATLQVELGDLGACEVLVADMVHYSKRLQFDEWCIQEVLSKALTVLATSNTVNTARLGAAGACAVIGTFVAKAPACYSSYARGVHCALEAVNVLAVSDLNRATLGTAGVCTAVIHSLVQLAAHTDVVHWSCKAVQILAYCNDANKAKLMAAGAQGAIQRALLIHATTASEQHQQMIDSAQQALQELQLLQLPLMPAVTRASVTTAAGD